MKRIKDAALVLFILVVIGIFATDYAQDRESEEKTADAERIPDEMTGQRKETYIFLDVEGNVYKAPLLHDIPQCAYDLECLSTDEKTGYKSFYDEKNHISAKPSGMQDLSL